MTAWQSRIASDAQAAGAARRSEGAQSSESKPGRRKMRCEKCDERLELTLPNAEAWHASCKAKGLRAALPRYVEVT